MSGLPYPYPPQDPEYTQASNQGPIIMKTVQPKPVANVATDVSNIIPQLLTSMQYMQKNQTGEGGQTSNSNTCTCQSETEPRQGQSHKPLLDFSKKCFWAHLKGAHDGAAFKNKAPKH